MSIFQAINNVCDFNMPLSDVVAAMRFHHQLLPPHRIFWGPYKPIEGDPAQQMEAKGYPLKGQDFSGDVQAIRVNGDMPEPAADPRGYCVTRVTQ